MAKKNSYRADNTFLIEGGNRDNPKLMGRALVDGRASLYLEFYEGKHEVVSKSGKVYNRIERHTEPLGLYLWRAPRTAEERQQNKEVLDLAKRQRFERAQQMLEDSEGYRLKSDRDTDILAWMRAYLDNYTKGDKRSVKRAYDCFVAFLIDPGREITPEPGWTTEERKEARAELTKRAEGLTLKARLLTKKKVIAFTDYLQERFRGEGPHTAYARFKKMIKAAVEEEVLRKNPCEGVTITVDNGSLKKDILSMEEMERLIATHYDGESADIRRAFIFCLYTGLRWCDVSALTYANVDSANRLLRFEQSKTRGHSSASGVVIPLNDGLLALIGKGERGALIFPLPTHNMCLKALRHWTAKAGIEKHITWHCARHSFAVNILNNGANIKTVASLLGHSSLQHTEKYTRAVDSLKEAAINSLPELKL